MATITAIRDIKLSNATPLRQGKVRQIYELGDKYLFATSDRISAFDHVLPQGIPHKGAVLNSISVFWFNKTQDIVKNHLLSTNVADYPEQFKNDKDILDKRSMLVKKTRVLPIECIVRGYIEGSGWKSYQKDGTVCGYQLPEGLQQGDKLPEILFTPSTKAEEGHDINITVKECENIIGKELTDKLRDISIKLYKFASEYALEKGIIIADTKFEFGLDENNELYLIDEVLTPDSSRFWLLDEYQPGQSQKSFDKQFVRDYLESINWDKEPPIPDLPVEIVNKTSEKYLEAFQKITGKSLL